MCRFAYNDKYASGPWRFGRKGCRCGFESNEEKMCSGADSSAVPDAGVGAAGMRRVRRRAAHTGPQAGTVLPEGAKKEEGVVLDASDGQFILRAAGGGEYVFRMDGAEDMVEGGVQAGQYVRIWYDGVLTDTNARNVKLLRIEAAQETQPDSLSMGSTADGVVTAFDEESITLRTAGGETYTFAAGRSYVR